MSQHHQANSALGLFRRIQSDSSDRTALQEAAQLAIQVEFTTPACLTGLYSISEPDTPAHQLLRGVVIEDSSCPTSSSSAPWARTRAISPPPIPSCRTRAARTSRTRWPSPRRRYLAEWRQRYAEAGANQDYPFWRRRMAA
ncbi:hypothetical protein [Methylomagnum sp.]